MFKKLRKSQSHKSVKLTLVYWDEFQKFIYTDDVELVKQAYNSFKNEYNCKVFKDGIQAQSLFNRLHRR